MDSFYRPTWLEISLDALRANLLAFRRRLPETIRMLAVVKADAYGHGAVEVAKEALDAGAEYLAVALLDEALELREAGVTAPILVLGYTPETGIPLALEHDITLTVFTDAMLEALAARAGTGKRARVHIKLDTGMGRIGLHDEEEALAFIRRAVAMPELNVEGMFTHFARADEEDKSYTFEQHARFERVVKRLDAEGLSIPLLHTGNSAAAIELPELSYNMVRLGISMYGIYPSDEVKKDIVRLEPVMALKTTIVHLKELPAGCGVSYGSRYVTQRDGERIATLPIGYADGYSRMLTGKAQALVRGVRVPVAGTICMDQCMLTLKDGPEAAIGDEVVLFGRQGEAVLAVEELADAMGTIPYEVVCMMARRLPRVYIRGGQAVRTVNRLQTGRNG
ncbi:alanine racemase [Paenibacillus sp. J31TS4]|uniref:alanine racemase n=1 Tax=Paenibacillus sp. J31TS4 TaxID=2807195 RepID=UPI001B2C735D|nr:alanine racemase [Paenibacillus sp. J31TS4]GIP39944.1 alanine racemase [Paenibacillus sp. J31TS4]